MERNEADLSVAGLTITIDRRTAIDMTVGVMSDPEMLVVAAPKGASIKVWAFLNAFDTVTWIAVLFMTILFTFTYAEAQALEESSTFWSERLIGGVAFSALYLLNRSTTSLKMSSTGRLLPIVAGLYSFVVYAYYSGALTSLLTISQPPHSVKSLTDVMDKGIQGVIWEGTITGQIMKDAPNGSILD